MARVERLMPEPHVQGRMAHRQLLQGGEALDAPRPIAREGPWLHAVLPAPRGMAGVTREQDRARRRACDVGGAPRRVPGHRERPERPVTEDVEQPLERAGRVGPEDPLLKRSLAREGSVEDPRHEEMLEAPLVRVAGSDEHRRGRGDVAQPEDVVEVKVREEDALRRIAALELVVGEPLFERSVEGTSLTAVGERLVEPARRMAEEVGEIERVAQGVDARPGGVVRITAAPGMAFERLAPFAAHLRRVLPEIRLEVLSTVAYVDLARREADLALRFDRPPQRDLVSLAQLEERIGAFASRKYVASLPRGYGLTDVDWIGWTPERAHLPPNPQLAARIPGFRPAFASDDFLVQLRAAETGAGAIVLGHGRSKRSLPSLLVPLALDLGKLTSTTYLVCARSSLAIARVRAVAELLVAELAAK